MAVGKNAGANSQSSNDFLLPHAPVSVSATNVGTGRAYDDGAASVSFTLPVASPAADTFTVVASTGETATGSSSPIVIGGLASGAVPTFTVSGTNEWGTGESSSASNSVTVTTVPATMSSPTVSSPTPSASANVAGTTTDSVSWTAPATGGAAITQYTWTSSDGKTGTTTGTSVSVNQEGGTAQTYSVRAQNANGSGVYSSNSASITTFSFTPFSFVPFGAFGFTPFSFTPFSFVPFGAFGFVPFGFVPFGAFAFTPFNFVPFGAFGFTPFNFTPKVRAV